MEQKNKSMNRDRIIAGGSILLFAGAFTFGVIQSNAGADLRTQRDEQRSQNEQLLDRSTQLKMELAGRDLRLAGMSEELAQLQSALRSEQQRAEEALRKAASASAARPRNDVSKAELEKLKAQIMQLEQSLASANGRMADLTADNTKLRGTNEKLAQDISRSTENAALVNNSLIETTRGKKAEKLVVKARRTQHLNMDLEMPADLAANARMKVTGPDGKSFEIADPVITASTVQTVGEATASAGGGAIIDRRMSRVKMKLIPKEKLVAGTYRIDVYSGKKYLGTTRTTLR